MVKEIIFIKCFKMTKVNWLTPKLNIFEMEAYGPVVFPKETFEPIYFLLRSVAQGIFHRR